MVTIAYSSTIPIGIAGPPDRNDQPSYNTVLIKISFRAFPCCRRLVVEFCHPLPHGDVENWTFVPDLPTSAIVEPGEGGKCQ